MPRRSQGKGPKSSGKKANDKAKSAPAVIESSSPVVSRIPGLPVLQARRSDGSPNYLEPWKQEMALYVLREYGDIGHMFSIDEYYEEKVEEYDPDDFNEENDPHGFYKAEFLTSNNERIKDNRRMRKQRPQVYAVMYGQLSDVVASLRCICYILIS